MAFEDIELEEDSENFSAVFEESIEDVTAAIEAGNREEAEDTLDEARSAAADIIDGEKRKEALAKIAECEQKIEMLEN